jgi:hypothetical protein
MNGHRDHKAERELTALRKRFCAQAARAINRQELVEQSRSYRRRLAGIEYLNDLELEAEERGIGVRELEIRILKIVVRDGLIDAILDD